MAQITASILYDLVQCPHRVTMDLYGDAAERDEINTFVELLWKRGQLYEREVIAGLKEPFLDLSTYAGAEKERLTREAMERGEPLIYGGRISADDLLGDPDFLRKEGNGYVPGDIKSGAGEEGQEDEKKPKKHYAVQLALYVDVLERLKLSAGRRGFIWDIHGEIVPYDLAAPKGSKTLASLWDDYQQALAEARAITSRAQATLPAYAAACKLCHWYTHCIDEMRKAGDLTLIPELGRAARERMVGHVKSIAELAGANPEAFINGNKTIFEGVGPDRLKKFHSRAALLHASGKAYLRGPLTLPHADLELFFDIEDDPFRKLCYLHGFVERRKQENSSERYIAFFAEEPTEKAEQDAFAQAIHYIQHSRPHAMYYFSKHERTTYRKLREKYPGVISNEELEAIFDPASAVDLYYDVVLKATEWPTNDYSIKTLATHLGFNWRDTHPSGAASIEWFHTWLQSKDEKDKQRILNYNEDDCTATRVLLDGIRRLSLAM